MADPIKVISQEIALTTANTVSGASLVRLVNVNPTTDALITIRNSSNTIIGSFTLGSSAADFSNEYVVKQPTDTVEASGGTVKAVSVAYR